MAVSGNQGFYCGVTMLSNSEEKTTTEKAFIVPQSKP